MRVITRTRLCLLSAEISSATDSCKRKGVVVVVVTEEEEIVEDNNHDDGDDDEGRRKMSAQHMTTWWSCQNASTDAHWSAVTGARGGDMIGHVTAAKSRDENNR